MAKKILAVQLLVDEKHVHQAASFFDASDKIISEDDLQRRFFDRSPVVCDVSELEDEAFGMTMGFVGFIMTKEQEENDRP